MVGFIDREPKGYCPGWLSRTISAMRRMLSLDSVFGVPASRGRLATFATAVLSTALLVAIGFNTASDSALAGDGPKIVTGYVYDAVGNPLSGANVTLEVLIGMGPSVRTTMWYYPTSEIDGYYSITVDDFLHPWMIGDTLQVTAKYTGYQATNSTVATSSSTQPVQYVNVTISDVTIPEFGGFAGSVAFVSIGLVATVVIIRRRKTPA